MAASNNRRVGFMAPYQNVFNAFIYALPTRKIKLKFQDIQTGVIQGSRSVTFLSWGEQIYIRMGVVPSGETVVELRSECNGIQMVDYGINRKNIDAIITSVVSQLGVPAMPR